ncbi:MAG: cytochrome P450 [Novosphingobium sp.]|nr:cytochrome P450 [Novosphingobium sp.]
MGTDQLAIDFDLQELARHFDVNDPRLNDHFFETLQWMRERGPVHYSQAHGGYWVIVGHKEVVEAARDWRHFSSAAGVVVAGTKPQKYVPVEYDPPMHQAFRRILNPHFTKQMVAGYEPALRRFADALIDGFIGKGFADLAAEYAKPLAAHFFFCLLFRLPPDEAALCEAATDKGMFSERMEDQIAGFAQLEEFVGKLVERRKGHPSDGSFIDLIRTATVDGRAVTDEELMGIIQLMIVGGDDTVVHAIGNMFLELGRNSELRHRLTSDPSLFPEVFEESIRHMPPAVSIARTVVEDIEIGGQQMRAGDKVALVWPSANRDDCVFPEADRFRLGRENIKQHIAFGGGVHKCLGEWVARSIVGIATERLLARVPDFVIERDSVIGCRMGQSRGPTNVPAVFIVPPSPT